MSQIYIVKQGDHLTRIAAEHGFTDYQKIWNHPDNADLKNKRQNPNVLFPGDRIIIPDKEAKQQSCPTDQQHQFVVNRRQLQLRLVLEDIYEKPIAGAHCDLVIDQDLHHLTTDGVGKVQVDITAQARQGWIVLRDPQTPFDGETISFRIGHLDPVEELSGQQARLNNLGYFAAEQIGGKEDEAFRSAVEEFQCDHGLTVDGLCGPLSQAKLKQVHGC